MTSRVVGSSRPVATWLAATAVAIALLRLPAADARAASPPPSVVDLHVDLSYQTNFRHEPFARGTGQYVASKLLGAGVAGVVLPLFVPKDASPTGPRAEDLETSFTRLMSSIPETPPYSLPGCAPRPGGVRTWLSFEGAAPLSGDPDAVPKWVARGVRIFGLVHTSDNALASSSGSGAPATFGLTPAGRELVKRVHRAGAVVDVSHASDAATDEIIALALADHVPVVATHSDARAITPHPRNLTDEQIRGIASTGGVVGVNFHSRFLASDGHATLADVVRHVEHLVKVGGVDHVAIGSDFEGDIRAPEGLTSVLGFPRLARALRAAGFSEHDVEGIFGRNALRVLCPAAPASGASDAK
jgi:membrane dipeptidase